jgi:hypothetical protein
VECRSSNQFIPPSISRRRKPRCSRGPIIQDKVAGRPGLLTHPPSKRFGTTSKIRPALAAVALRAIRETVCEMLEPHGLGHSELPVALWTARSFIGEPPECDRQSVGQKPITAPITSRRCGERDGVTCKSAISKPAVRPAFVCELGLWFCGLKFSP